MTKIRSHAQLGLKSTLAVLLAASFQAAEALEYALFAGYEGQYTSNASRVPEDESEEEDVIHRPSAALMASHETDRLSFTGDYQVIRRIYEDDNFETENVVEGSAEVQWSMVPDRFSVFARNQRRETKVDVAEEQVPDNLQITKRTSAGSTLRLDSIANHFMSFTYEYSETGTSDSDVDSDRQSVSAAYTIPISGIDQLEIAGVRTEVEFDSDLIPEYEATTGTIQFSRQTSRNNALFRLGYSSFDRDLSRDTADGIVGAFQYSREMSDQTTLAISYTQDFQDSALDAAPGFIDADSEFIGDTDIAEVYERQELAFNFGTTLARNRFDFALIATSQDYEDVERDTERVGGRIEIGRQLSRSLSGSLDGAYWQYDFEDRGREDDEYQIGINIDWEATRRFDVSFGVAYFERSFGSQLAKTKEWSASIAVDVLLLGESQ